MQLACKQPSSGFILSLHLFHSHLFIYLFISFPFPLHLFFFLPLFFNCLFTCCFVRLGKKRNGATLCGHVRFVQVSRPDCTATTTMCVRCMSKKTGVCRYSPAADFLPPNLLHVAHFHKTKTKIAFIIRSLNSMITQLFLIFQHSVQCIMSPKSPNFVYLTRRSWCGNQ